MWGDGGVRKACRLLRGGVDRNIDLLADAPDVGRRLLRGGVDRNVKALRPLLAAPGRLLRGGVDSNVAAVTQHIEGPGRLLRGDRKHVVSGKSVAVRVDLGGSRTLKQTTVPTHTTVSHKTPTQQQHT